MMVRAVFFLLVLTLVYGLLGFLLLPFLGIYTLFLVSGLGALNILLLWGTMPRLSKEAWIAEDNDGVLVLLHGDDQRIVPLATYYSKRTNMLKPLTRLKNLYLIPDPDSTLPVQGHKLKLGLAYINSPYLFRPDMILVAYDLKRMDLENLGQAIEYDRAYKNADELAQKLEETRQLYEALMEYDSPDELPDELRKVLPEEVVEDTERFLEYREMLRKYIEDMEKVLRMLQKAKKRKPLAFIRSRIYTVKDILGYIAYHIRPTRLMSIGENYKLEGKLEAEQFQRKAVTYAVLIVAMAIAAVIIIGGLALLLGGGAHLPSLPTPAPPKVEHVNITSKLVAWLMGW